MTILRTNSVMDTINEVERFESKYDKQPSGCHVWNGPLDRDGYGTFFFRKLNRRAHRVAWFLIHGPIPNGMIVNHKCRNRACVNHQHLELITRGDNALLDSGSVAALNARKTHCPKGHPYDRKYGKQRYCSICEREKQTRLRLKWRAEDPLRGSV